LIFTGVNINQQILKTNVIITFLQIIFFFYCGIIKNIFALLFFNFVIFLFIFYSLIINICVCLQLLRIIFNFHFNYWLIYFIKNCSFISQFHHSINHSHCLRFFAIKIIRTVINIALLIILLIIIWNISSVLITESCWKFRCCCLKTS